MRPSPVFTGVRKDGELRLERSDRDPRSEKNYILSEISNENYSTYLSILKNSFVSPTLATELERYRFGAKLKKMTICSMKMYFSCYCLLGKALKTREINDKVHN